MRIRFSPLVTEASGSAGPLVASRWKGRPYLRSRVTPANPNSVDQQSQRARMRAVVNWWHEVAEEVRDYVDLLAAGGTISGFNEFVKRSVKDNYDELNPRFIPLTSDIVPLASCSAVPGDVDPGDLTVSWLAGSAVATNLVYILAGPIDGTGLLPNHIALYHENDNTVNGSPQGITVADADTLHLIIVLVEKLTGGEFSPAVCCEATSFAGA